MTMTIDVLASAKIIFARFRGREIVVTRLIVSVNCEPTVGRDAASIRQPFAHPGRGRDFRLRSDVYMRHTRAIPNAPVLPGSRLTMVANAHLRDSSESGQGPPTVSDKSTPARV